MWGVVAVVVEPRLPHRDGPLVRKQCGQLVHATRIGPGGVVRMDAERGVDTVVLVGEGERRTRRLDPRPDRDHARHADGATLGR